jgi:hypothetical protein
MRECRKRKAESRKQKVEMGRPQDKAESRKQKVESEAGNEE